MPSKDETIGDIVAATRDALDAYAAGRDAETAALREQLADAQAYVCPDPAAHDAAEPDPDPEEPEQPEEPPVEPEEPEEPPVEPDGKTIIGYSTKAEWWGEEMTKLVPHADAIGARRIFADLAKGARDKETLIRAAVKAGQMPVVSYKIGGASRIASVIDGSLDTAARQAGEFLASLGVEVRVVVWHEPNGDLTPEDFVKVNRRLIPLLKSPKVKAGCFINGWLLDRQEATFTAYMSDSLVEVLDWVGLDAYHAGSIASPDPSNTPGYRIRNMLAHCKKRGITKPIGIGEYNAFSAAAMKDAGEVILANPQIEFACMWSSTTEIDFRLKDDRLAAFKATLADPRTGK